MKILVIAPYVPWPLHGGAALRMYHVLRAMSAAGHDITLVAGHPKSKGDEMGDVRAYCRVKTFLLEKGPRDVRWSSLLSPTPYPWQAFRTPAFSRAFDDAVRVEGPDLVWVNFLGMAAPEVFAKTRGAPVIIDQHENDRLLWTTYLDHGSIAGRAFSRWNLRKIRRLEAGVLPRVAGVVVVSNQERAFLCTYAPAAMASWTVPNGFDAEAFRPAPPADEGSDIIICGGMQTRRNVEATQWFVEDVLPRIRTSVPAATLHIVGSEPAPEIRALAAAPGVTVTGTVDDVRPFYVHAQVAVVPMRRGAGTKLKVLEAFALGRPVVTTENGAAGLEARTGTHLIVADDAASMADAVSGLLKDAAARQQLASNARRLVEERFDWAKVLAPLDKILQDACGRTQ